MVEKRFTRVAYGKPKDIKGAGKLINTGSNVGVRIVQWTRLRPISFGYRKGRSR